jgi:hypothetical protein
MRHELERIREWANAKIQGGNEPPWAWYQYMKLRETVDAILDGMDATVTQPHSLGSEGRSDKHLRLAADNSRPNNARRRPGTVPVRLPT